MSSKINSNPVAISSMMIMSMTLIYSSQHDSLIVNGDEIRQAINLSLHYKIRIFRPHIHDNGDDILIACCFDVI